MNKKSKQKDKECKLEKDLSFESVPIWENMKEQDMKKCFSFCDGYMDFLSVCKTERECITRVEKIVVEQGFRSVSDVETISPGDAIYIKNREKNIIIFRIGSVPCREGINLIGSHVDSPRLDLKPLPLTEDKDAGVALLRTHYYGGLKKYHWVNIPLALHGVVVKEGGERVHVNLGEDDDDPTFVITDLLPHLSAKQNKRKLSSGITGEELQAIVGSIPHDDENAKARFKLNVLNELNARYGIKEEDLISSELQLVPSGRAKHVGFDRSMVGAYGQDDRICAYTSLMALLALGAGEVKRTSACILFDREEVGSDGSSGVKSRFLYNALGELMRKMDEDFREFELREAMENTFCLSADVNGAVNPLYKNVHEKENAAFLGHGIVMTKYTGSRGKYSSSEASAEFVARVRRVLNQEGVCWQTGELGKVDEGGGGTVAKFLAEHNMDVLDAGPALISMHSPMEISSKADIYHTYLAYMAFFGKM